ncbi:MAG: hypothetical protein VB119_10615 [Candidatus Metalachnospira sp.]|nr:hypothetical protein [Candidatus Metalachnospira sp.]
MKAFFIRNPRRIDDLFRPNLMEEKQEYEIVKKIKLKTIDYENFITDMYADRQFIEDNADLCSEGDILRCLLICRRGKNDGILVVPEMTAYVKWAAYISEVQKCELR